MEYQKLVPADPAYPEKLRARLGEEAPALYYQGPLKLLDRFGMGVVCSDLIPGQCMIEANQLLFTIREYAMNYIGGWHSVMETEIFRLAMDRPTDPDNLRSLTMLTARGLARENWDNFLGDRFGYEGPFTGFPQKDEYYRRAQAGEILVMSATEPQLKRFLRSNIILRNTLSCLLADVVFVPYAGKGSKTYATCKKILPLGIPIFTVGRAENKETLDLGIPAYTRKTVGEFLEKLGAVKGSEAPFPDAATGSPGPILKLPSPPQSSPRQILLF
jgi:hypothetical protein